MFVTFRLRIRTIIYMKHLPLSLIAIVALTGCTSASGEKVIQHAIDEANYCDTEADCVMVGSKCPFGCYIYSNAKESDRMTKMIDAYESTCVYSCLENFGVDCINNKCEPRLPPPSQAQEFEGDPEGNVGASCTTDDQCVTPMDYLIRSSCPFTSMCIEGTCSVVCPMHEDEPNPADSQFYHMSCSADADCDCKGFRGENADCRCVDKQCVAVMK